MAYLIVLRADYIAHARIVYAVEHKVDDPPGDEHADNGVHRALVFVEYQRVGHDYYRVEYQYQRPEVNIREALPHELCHDVDPACRRADKVDDPKPRALYRAADYRAEHRVGRRHYPEEREQIDEGGAQRHAYERAEHEARAEVPPRYREERDVEDYRHRTDGQLRKLVYYHRYTDDPAGGYRVRVHEELEADGVYRRAENYHEKFQGKTESTLRGLVQTHTLLLFIFIRP